MSDRIALRAHFLDAYPRVPCRVLDFTPRRKSPWSALSCRYPLDVVSVAADAADPSSAVARAEEECWRADVFDLSCGRDPWPLWRSFCDGYVGGDATVFVAFSSGPIDSASLAMRMESRKLLGIPDDWNLWRSALLSDMSTSAELARVMDCGFAVAEARKLVMDGASRSKTIHLGVRIGWGGVK